MSGNFDSVSFDGSVGGFDTGVAPVSVGVGGGSGRPVYKRRKWRELRNVVDEGLQSVYEDIIAAGLPREVTAEAVKAVKPFADKAARFKSVPKASEVDWAAMERDVQLGRTLLEIYEQYVGEVAWARMLEEEDEILLLN